MCSLDDQEGAATLINALVGAALDDIEDNRLDVGEALRIVATVASSPTIFHLHHIAREIEEGWGAE